MPRMALVLVMSALVIFLIGLLMIFNTTSAEMLDRAVEGDTFQPLAKQVIYAALGFFLGLAVYKLGYGNLLRLAPALMFFGTVLLILVFVPKIGCEINGAKRWIGFQGFTFQPSEIMKYLIPLYAISFFQKNRSAIDFRFFFRLLVVLLPPIGLILMEPDNGT
ncbi:MAG: FtsW/RodA/SpoVE family cell cycle protein, partial [Parachlamydiales bacterium]